jgi:hypothetical protein
MHLSAVPPPVARRPAWFGFHAIALTAAWCSLNFYCGVWDLRFHIMSLLSFPPLANCVPSNDHLSPHISCLCESNLWVTLFPCLRSLFKIVLSLDPVLTVDPFHETALTLWSCPYRVWTSLQWFVSQIWVFPSFVPIARCCPRLLQPKLVILSSWSETSFLT